MKSIKNKAPPANLSSRNQCLRVLKHIQMPFIGINTHYYTLVTLRETNILPLLLIPSWPSLAVQEDKIFPYNGMWEVFQDSRTPFPDWISVTCSLPIPYEAVEAIES